MHPSDFGLRKAEPQDLIGGDAAANAAMLREILAGQKGPHRDVTLLNAGAALFIASRAASVREGIARAAEAIDSGAARDTLAAMAAASHRRARSTSDVKATESARGHVAGTERRSRCDRSVPMAMIERTRRRGLSPWRVRGRLSRRDSVTDRQ